MRKSFLLSFLILLFNCNFILAQNWAVQNKLTAALRNSSDNFGKKAAIADEYAIAGAEGDDYDASGLNYFNSSGAAHIHKKDLSGNWSVIQKIVSSDRAAYDYFGCSVAIDGEYAVAGAYGESNNVSGGAEMGSSGSVYVFKNISGTWTQVQKLVASDRAANDYFGKSVAISGQYIVVGATGEDHNASGTATLESAGSAYIFRNIDGTWTQVQKIVASDRGSSDYFGSAIAIRNDYIVIGAYAEDHDVSGQNTLNSTGSAYIFKNNSGTWLQVQKICASDRAADTSDDYFGYSVAIADKIIAIGAYWNEADGVYDAGAVYIFTDNAGVWSEEAKITAFDKAASDNFGTSVSLAGDYLAVGAHQEDHDASEVNSFSSAGSVYLFKRETGTWNLVQKIVATDRANSEYFGYSVSIYGDYILSGAYGDSHDASGTNPVAAAGSVFIFKKVQPVITIQPVDRAGACGNSTVNFIIGGENIANYKWQVSNNGGADFSDITDQNPYSGSSTDTLSILADASIDNNRYRCVVSNLNGSQTSQPVLLGIEKNLPSMTCKLYLERNTDAGQTTYTVKDDEFDLASFSDDCGILRVINDYNNLTSLSGAVFNTGSRIVTWSVTDNSGNISTCTSEIRISTPTNSEKTVEDISMVYPNPTNGRLYFSSRGNNNLIIKVFDLEGRLLKQTGPGNVSGIIDISDLNDATYIIMVNNGIKTERFRIIKN